MNSRVRRLISLAACALRQPARKTACCQRRAKRTTQEVHDIAWKAQIRFCTPYKSLDTYIRLINRRSVVRSANNTLDRKTKRSK